MGPCDDGMGPCVDGMGKPCFCLFHRSGRISFCEWNAACKEENQNFSGCEILKWRISEEVFLQRNFQSQEEEMCGREF